MKRMIPHTFWTAILALLVGGGSLLAKPATRVPDALWADGATYDTILTDTAFRHPPAVSTDLLYNFAMSGLEGQRSVAEAAPGDPDYNGGRWTVLLAVFTDEGLAVHDPDGDGMANFELRSEKEVLQHVELGHLVLMETDVYFECPLLRSR